MPLTQTCCLRGRKRCALFNRLGNALGAVSDKRVVASTVSLASFHSLQGCCACGLRNLRPAVRIGNAVEKLEEAAVFWPALVSGRESFPATGRYFSYIDGQVKDERIWHFQN